MRCLIDRVHGVKFFQYPGTKLKFDNFTRMKYLFQGELSRINSKANFFRLVFLSLFTPMFTRGQDAVKTDTTTYGNVTLIRDSRINELAKVEAGFNASMVKAPRSAKGFRLQLLNTTDREAAMRLRSQLLQLYPDQKVYMSFQPPYIKLKFGNFVDKDEANQFKKDILGSKLVSGNIYLLPEIVELKPEKNEQEPRN